MMIHLMMKKAGWVQSKYELNRRNDALEQNSTSPNATMVRIKYTYNIILIPNKFFFSNLNIKIKVVNVYINEKSLGKTRYFFLKKPILLEQKIDIYFT